MICNFSSTFAKKKRQDFNISKKGKFKRHKSFAKLITQFKSSAVTSVKCKSNIGCILFYKNKNIIHKIYVKANNKWLKLI